MPGDLLFLSSVPLYHQRKHKHVDRTQRKYQSSYPDVLHDTDVGRRCPCKKNTPSWAGCSTRIPRSVLPTPRLPWSISPTTRCWAKGSTRDSVFSTMRSRGLRLIFCQSRRHFSIQVQVRKEGYRPASLTYLYTRSFPERFRIDVPVNLTKATPRRGGVDRPRRGGGDRHQGEDGDAGRHHCLTTPMHLC